MNNLFYTEAHLIFEFKHFIDMKCVNVIPISEIIIPFVEFNSEPIENTNYLDDDFSDQIVKPETHAIIVIVPFIYNRSFVPNQYEGFKVILVTRVDVDMLPNEFDNVQDKRIHVLFSPERIESFVDRCSDMIQIMLDDSGFDKEELLDGLSFFGNFEAYKAYCINELNKEALEL